MELEKIYRLCRMASSFDDFIEKLKETDSGYKDELDLLLEMVSAYSRIPLNAMKSKCRKREIVEARQAYFNMAFQHTDNSKCQIGRKVNKDHATVIHGIEMGYLKSIKNLIKEIEPKFIKELNNFKRIAI
jgi:chromosomal replication initiation ATPase DnaA